MTLWTGSDEKLGMICDTSLKCIIFSTALLSGLAASNQSIRRSLCNLKITIIPSAGIQYAFFICLWASFWILTMAKTISEMKHEKWLSAPRYSVSWHERWRGALGQRVVWQNVGHRKSWDVSLFFLDWVLPALDHVVSQSASWWGSHCVNSPAIKIQSFRQPANHWLRQCDGGQFWLAANQVEVCLLVFPWGGQGPSPGQ